VLAGCGRIGFPTTGGDAGSEAGLDATDGAADALGVRHTAYIKPETPDANDRFGYSLALSADGQTLVVGAPLDDENANAVDNAGGAYVFERVGVAWVQRAYLHAADPAVNDDFGFAVAISADGSTIAIGSPDEDSASTQIDTNPTDTSAPNAGAAYIFARAGGWHQEAYLKASNTGAGDGFGSSIALSANGNLVVVGAPYEAGSTNTAPDIGASYTFRRIGATWSFETLLRSNLASNGDNFGWALAVASDGTAIAISSPSEDSASVGIGGDQGDESLIQSGAVFIFRFVATWTQATYIKPSSHQSGDFFGRALAYSRDGSTLAVASPGEDSVVANSGALYRFAYTGTWSETGSLKASNAGDDDQLGLALSLTGDGAELAAGAPLEDGDADANPAQGAVYRFTGNVQTDYVRTFPLDDGDQLGSGVSLSADGVTIAIAAPYEDSAATGVNGPSGDNSLKDSGCVWLFYD